MHVFTFVSGSLCSTYCGRDSSVLRVSVVPSFWWLVMSVEEKRSFLLQPRTCCKGDFEEDLSLSVMALAYCSKIAKSILKLA